MEDIKPASYTVIFTEDELEFIKEEVANFFLHEDAFTELGFSLLKAVRDRLNAATLVQDEDRLLL